MRRFCPNGHDKEVTGTYSYGDVERCRECRKIRTRARDRLRRQLIREIKAAQS